MFVLLKVKGDKFYMDWRGRKYYIARFSSDSYNMRINILKNINGVRLHSPTQHNFHIKISDENESRGYYHILIGCTLDASKIVEYELKKATKVDGIHTIWKEIKQDTSKKYFDIYDQEMPYRKCDLNPHKRCNHCMDC
jgi:hypothetical protein